MLDLETVDVLPKSRRGGGRRSEEREQIQAALREGKVQKISGIDAEKKFNALQQKIRQAATAIDMKVHISFQRNEDGVTGDLYFEGYDPTTVPAKTTKKKD